MRNITRVLNEWREPKIWEQPDRIFGSGMVGRLESIGNDFESYARDLYRANSVVATCVGLRMRVFSEVRFLWRDYEEGRPQRALYGDESLRILDQPWPNGTTGELLAHMEQDNALTGNFYAAVVGKNERLRRLRPDWVRILTGIKNTPGDQTDPNQHYALEAEPVMYIYQPPGAKPTKLTPSEVIHYSPLPDPTAQWRGMSWLTPVVNEVLGDKAATKHKQQFFKKGAVPGLAITYDRTVGEEQVKELASVFAEKFEGLSNAYKTLHLGGGADVTPIGATMQQLDFKSFQGHGESRIAAASGLGAVMAQFSEGMAGSSLNAGNFAAARKRAETTLFRPLWRIAAASVSSILTPPKRDAELTYDPSGVAFLRDDAKEEAQIRRTDAVTIRNLTDAGFTPESAVAAVTTGNWDLLEHSGLFSVQLQKPQSQGATT